jgi:hypothetical protein
MIASELHHLAGLQGQPFDALSAEAAVRIENRLRVPLLHRGPIDEPWLSRAKPVLVGRDQPTALENGADAQADYFGGFSRRR